MSTLYIVCSGVPRFCYEKLRKHFCYLKSSLEPCDHGLSFFFFLFLFFFFQIECGILETVKK